jgi:hypothetical protein
MRALGDRNYYRPPLRKDASKPQQQGGLLTAGACQPLLYHLGELHKLVTPGAVPDVAMILCAWRVGATGALAGEGAAQDFWGAVSAMLTGAVGNEGQAAIVMQLKTVRPRTAGSLLCSIFPCPAVFQHAIRSRCLAPKSHGCVYLVGFVVWVSQLYGEYLRGLNLEEIEELATALLAKQP